ncbi:hypothetical protein Ae201684P_020278 [Aphanomyces euteiches]|uniref:Uncharacterized protein n=1 Tax=Aphanomyces euteiches TaxID=100861 RepID=A0A6G0WFY0_9STRA|nr:hypothetical protein Ae201684_015561 [Aphanomyces euteiches]KAH9084015.1 hypothetical protein Ae201684P_020278 [Aphanomyces euteiches]KAH9144646.1 hypothetical protein AeRB84_011404 [Aphanomyces euteiches]
MAWILLAAALAICSIVEAVSQVSLNCAYSDLQQPYISIVEFNRSNNMFQLVDHNCQILNTSSVQPSTNYQAVGNVQDYAESSLSVRCNVALSDVCLCSTFGNIPI